MKNPLSIATPVGPFYVAVSRGHVVWATFRPGKYLVPHGSKPGDLEILALAKREVEEYFSGQRGRFTVPLKLEGTPFQRSVWEEAAKIPCGRTLTYGELARRIKKHRAARAVGNALGRNPAVLFIPCHRVVPASGGVGGFGSGPEVKRALLDLEKKVCSDAT